MRQAESVPTLNHVLSAMKRLARLLCQNRPKVLASGQPFSSCSLSFEASKRESLAQARTDTYDSRDVPYCVRDVMAQTTSPRVQ